MTPHAIRNLFLGCALAAFTGAVSAAPPAVRTPVALHVRLDIVDTESNDMKKARFASSLQFSMPAVLVAGKDGPHFSHDDGAAAGRLEGWVVGHGRLQIGSANGTISEQFDMRGSWSGPVVDLKRGWLSITMPRQAKFGDGLDFQLKGELPLSGNAQGSVQGGGRSQGTPGASAAPSPCKVSSSSTAVCTFEFHLAPAPTRARNPGTESILEQMKAAEADTNAVNVLAMMGMMNGLSTDTLPGGHVIMRLQRAYAGPIARRIDLHVWSSSRSDQGLPPGVPPLPAPPAPTSVR